MGSESIAHEAEDFEDSRRIDDILAGTSGGIVTPGVLSWRRTIFSDPAAKNSTQSPSYPTSHASNWKANQLSLL